MRVVFVRCAVGSNIGFLLIWHLSSRSNMYVIKWIAAGSL